MFFSVVGVSVAVVRVGMPEVRPPKPENVVVTGLSGIPLVPLAIDDRISATDILRSADSLLLAVVVQYMAIGFFAGDKTRAHTHARERASAFR